MHNTQKTQKPGSIIEIIGTLPAAFLVKERVHMLEILAKQTHIDGFRAGTPIPEAILVQKFGDDYIKEKTAEHALDHELPHLFAEHGVLPIVPPHIGIQLQADGSASVTITATVYPAVTLPDYKQIAADVMKGRTETKVTDEDVLDALTHFRRERMRIELIEANRNPDNTLATPEAELLKTADEATLETLPPLDDEFVKQIGFDSIALFEEHVRKELHAGKSQQERSERRAKILKELCAKPIADVPEPLIEYELAKMDAGLADYLAQAGKSLEGYYASVAKTKADIHTEWKPEAIVRAQHQLALIEIAKREKIQEDEKEWASLVENVLKRQPNADKHAVEAHYQVLLRNEKVMEWLESQA
jgi:FKBP-type peptidyl-prolyl cis-trans isomerase (trigger factor)